MLASVFVFFGPDSTAPNEVPWLDFGPAFHVPSGVTIDHLSKIMLLVVTGIGALVHIYSLVYMAEDESEGRYFGNLSLFMFSMLGIVLANNFVMMFIFWELVGVSSYLLIGHWFTRDCRGGRGEQGFHHQSHRRLRLHARHPDDLARQRHRSSSARSQTTLAVAESHRRRFSP